jgi:hypothetical protein
VQRQGIEKGRIGPAELDLDGVVVGGRDARIPLRLAADSSSEPAIEVK